MDRGVPPLKLNDGSSFRITKKHYSWCIEFFQYRLWYKTFISNCIFFRHVRLQLIMIDFIVSYRPTDMRWLCKQRPFLGNGWVNIFPLLGSRFLIMQQLDYNSGRAVYSMWSVPRCYSEERTRNGGRRITTVRSCCQRSVGVNTAGWKWHSGCYDYLWIVEMSGGPVNACSSESCA
jgi:hypothetical protein